MKHGRLCGSLVVLAAFVLSSIGCVSEAKYKELQAQHTELNAKYTAAMDANRKQRQDLTKTEQEKSILRSALEKKDGELVAANAEIERLRRGKTDGPDGNGPKPVYKTTVGSDILFSSGQVTLTSAGQRALDTVAAKLKSSFPGMMVRVYGYTDSDPIKKSKWRDNLDLSANRAMAVTRYLWSKGIGRDRVETIAMGEANPVASNSNSAGKAKNRRVEIVVVK